MRARGSYKPKSYEYEVLQNGDALIRFYENITEFEDPETETSGWEYDCYTITRPHSERLQEFVKTKTAAWRNLAKDEEFNALASEVRAVRNNMLNNTDKTQLLDAPFNHEAWAAYRQALRDVPEQPGFPYDVEFPPEPTENDSRAGSSAYDKLMVIITEIAQKTEITIDSISDETRQRATQQLEENTRQKDDDKRP